MTFDKPITIQVQDLTTEEWSDTLKLHAHVNKTGSAHTFNAGTDQYHVRLTFTVRYGQALEAIAYSPQPYRVLYKGRKFRVTDYDDYMEQHRTIKLVGELYE